MKVIAKDFFGIWRSRILFKDISFRDLSGGSQTFDSFDVILLKYRTATVVTSWNR